MKLRKVRVKGFQAFADTGEIEFRDGINLIIGANNVGKSALLRALRPELADDRHRSPDCWEGHKLPTAQVEMAIELSGKEFKDAIIRRVLNARPNFIKTSIPVPHSDIEMCIKFIKDMINSSTVKVNLLNSSCILFVTSYESTEVVMIQYDVSIVPRDKPSIKIIFRINEQEIDYTNSTTANTPENSMHDIMKQILMQNMFHFSAERTIQHKYSASRVEQLMQDASNLAAVLYTLQGESGDLFSSMINHVRGIFPTVGNITVGPVAPNSGDAARVEIFVWPTKARERPQLRSPLAECGTGVAQVIAILTAVMTCENAVIIIDEINTFLHPAAVKALLRILQTEYGHHQYIIASHSPEVIASGAAQSIHLVRREGYESWVEKLDIGKIAHLREAAGQLGISMMDVFAAERIVWVEGETEELCFPRLYEMATEGAPRHGVRFIAVVSTGDFQRKRDKELVFKIYERLWKTALPLARSAVISFDSEELPEEEKNDMTRRSNGAIQFLPRRNLECYFLDPEAIAEFISERLPGEAPITHEKVAGELSKLAASPKYKRSCWSDNLGDPVWLKQVDGAKLLSEVCENISENRVTYNKIDDAYALISKIDEKNQNHLDELLKYVKGLVEAVSASPGKA